MPRVRAAVFAVMLLAAAARGGDERAALSGRLTDVSGRAVAGAKLVAEPLPPFEGYPDPRKPVETTAGADGSYAFGALAPGDWALRCSFDGAVRAPAGIVRLPDVAHFDPVLPIGGTVAGTLLDADSGEPLAGATVRVIDLSHEVVVEVQTSKSGMFSALLHRDNVWVWSFCVEAAGHASRPTGWEHDDRGDGLDEGERLDVGLKLGRGTTLRGTVTGPSGPLAGAHVTVDVMPLDGDFSSRKLATDSQGRWELEGLDADASVAVRAAAEGLMEAATHRLEYAAQPERFFWSCPETSRVEGLSGAGAVQHDIALISAEPWPTTTVEGHVLDSDGKPIAGAEVAGFDGTKQVTTTSGADGAFSLAGVAIDDEYVEVGASHPEFVPFAQPAAAKAGETVCGVEFKLPRRPRVHGKVTDGSGETVAGARVFVIDEDVPGRCVFGAGPSGPRFQLVQMTTDAAGAYSAFIDLGHGLLTVHAEAAGITAASARVEEAQDRRDYAMDVVLPVRVSIVGRIAAKASAEGVSGVPVAVVREPWTESDHADDLRDKTIVVRSVTAANGDFRIDGVAPGRWLVVAGDAMSTSARAVCDVPNKDPLVLVVEPALMLRGTVEFTEGGPAAGVKVSVWPGPRRGVGTDQIGDDRVTGADGRFVVRGLVKGAYWLDLDVGEPSIQEAYVGPFDAGKPVPPIRVKRGLVLAGRVVDAGGNGVEKAAVFADAAEEESPRPRGMQYTAEDGSFRLAGLDEGPYVVRVRAAGFLLRAKTDVKAGGEALVVTMDRGLAIEGVVIDADGRLVEGLRFDASPVGHAGDEQNAESDEHGRFRITGLTPGRWKLSANQWRGQGDETAPPFPAALVVEAGTKDVRLECPRRTKDASGDK